MDIVKPIEEIARFGKRSPVAGILLSIIGILLLQVLVPKILEDVFSRDSILFLIGIILVLVVVLGIGFIQDSKKKKSGVNPTVTKLETKYKGLIFTVSTVSTSDDPTKNKKNVESIKPENTKYTIDEIKEKIEAIDLKSPNFQQELEYLYTLKGVGQTFKAIFHHYGTLQYVWLLHTDKSKTTGALDLIEKFINKIDNRILLEKVELEDYNKIEPTYKSINKIYTEGIKDKGLTEKDVIADITSGTALMSCAFVLACLSPERDLEYVGQQKGNPLMKIEEKIGDIILKK